MGQNQLSSEEYGSNARGPDVFLNFLSFFVVSPHSVFGSCFGLADMSIGGRGGNSKINYELINQVIKGAYHEDSL